MSAEPLQWEGREPFLLGDTWRWCAKTDFGTYWVYSIVEKSYTIWCCQLMKGDALGDSVYRGDSMFQAKVEAYKHYSAQLTAIARAAAWERYMAENDPPEVESAR